MATIVNKQDPRAEQWSSALRSFGKSYAEQSHLSQSLAERAKDRAMQMLALNLAEARYAEGAESRRLQQKQLKQSLDEAKTEVAALDALGRLRDNHHGVANFNLEPAKSGAPQRWHKGTPTSNLQEDLKIIKSNKKVWAQYIQAAPSWKRTQEQTLARLQSIELAPPNSALRIAIETMYGRWDDLDEDNKIAIAGTSGNDIIKLMTAYMSKTRKPLTAVEYDHTEALSQATASMPFSSDTITKKWGPPDPRDSRQVAYIARVKKVQEQVKIDKYGNPLPLGSLESLTSWEDTSSFGELSDAERTEQLQGMINGELVSFQYNNAILIKSGSLGRILSLRLDKIITGLNKKLAENEENKDETDKLKEFTDYEKLIQVIVNPESSTAIDIGDDTKVPANKLLLAKLLTDNAGWHNDAKSILTGKPVTRQEALAALGNISAAGVSDDQADAQATVETAAESAESAPAAPQFHKSYTAGPFQNLTLSNSSISDMASNSFAETGVEVGTQGYSSDGILGPVIPDEIRYATDSKTGARVERNASNFIRDTYYTEGGASEGSGSWPWGPVQPSKQSETAFSKKIHEILSSKDGGDEASRIGKALNTTENHLFEAHVHDRLSNQFIKSLVALYKDDTDAVSAILGFVTSDDGVLHDLASDENSDSRQGYLEWRANAHPATIEIFENLERIFMLVERNYKHFKRRDRINHRSVGLVSGAIRHYMGS